MKVRPRSLVATVAAIGITAVAAGAGSAAYASTAPCAAQASAPERHCGGPGSWLSLSDVHFDPFAGLTTATVDHPPRNRRR